MADVVSSSTYHQPDERPFTTLDHSGQETTHSKEEGFQHETSEGASTDESENKGRKIFGFRWLIICIALYSTCALYGLDMTIAADVQGSVITAFGHVEQLAWVGAGFPLGSICVNLFLGTLYETFDMKWVFIVTTLLFEVGSALCGAAPSMSALIVGRVIAGAGGSGIYLGCLQYFTAMTGKKERGFYMSLIGIFWGLGAVLGPVVGGAFSISSATWRWAFYINLVVGVVSAPVFFTLPSVPNMPGVSFRDKLALFDFVGLVLGAGFWTCFLLAFTMAGGQWEWSDPSTIATFVVLGVVFILYASQQYFALWTTPERRAFPVHLLRDRTHVLLYMTTAAGTSALFIVVYYIPIYFQFVNNDGALQAAVRLLPFMVVAVTVNLISGSLLHYIKIYMIIFMIASTFLVLGGSLLVVYLDPSSKTGTIYGLTVLLGVGSGLTMIMGYLVATLTTKPSDAGAALSLQNVAQIGSQVIALAVAGQTYQSTAIKKLTKALAGHGYSDKAIWGAVAGAQSTLFKELNGELREKAIKAVTEAMQMTFVLAAVAGGVMLIAALCMKRERLFGQAVAVAG